MGNADPGHEAEASGQCHQRPRSVEGEEEPVAGVVALVSSRGGMGGHPRQGDEEHEETEEVDELVGCV